MPLDDAFLWVQVKHFVSIPDLRLNPARLARQHQMRPLRRMFNLRYALPRR